MTTKVTNALKTLTKLLDNVGKGKLSNLFAEKLMEFSPGDEITMFGCD
jgi:hypothetical protein